MLFSNPLLLILLCSSSVVYAELGLPLSETRFGIATHYGPWPSDERLSEGGYLDDDVGVGCSSGLPGGDPKWKEVLSHGTYPAPNFTQNAGTVWPKFPTVAISQASWGGRNKKFACWILIDITNVKADKTVRARVVDFCPTVGCLWSREERENALDIYGEETWKALGGSYNGYNGRMDIKVVWPAGMIPNSLLDVHI